jgi:hypothetical protein
MKAQDSLRPLLSGGDRRSIAQSARALKLVRADPALVAQVARLAVDKDWLVSMRAMDVLEKLAHERPEWIQPHKHLFIGPLADSAQWEIRLQVVRALPLLSWSTADKKRVLEIRCRASAEVCPGLGSRQPSLFRGKGQYTLRTVASLP